MRLRRIRLSLRSRVAVMFSGASVAVAGVIGVVIWQLASTYMLDQRQQSADLQASVNLSIIERSLTDGTDGLDDLLNGVAADAGATALVRIGDDAWRQGGRPVRPAALPASLLTAVDGTQRSWQRLEVNGLPVLAVVIPSPPDDIVFVQLFPLAELTRIYRFLTLVLIGGVAASGILGALVGYWTSRRALRPLTELTRTAGLVAAGDLSIRLPDRSDPDLAPLASTFNDTVASLERRVRQDERFAADVSHELRSPLTTMVNAVELLEHRRDELPPTSGQAVDLLADEIQRFQRLVVDLLEISRPDTVVDPTELELLDLAVLVRTVAAHQLGRAPVIPQPVPVLGDRRRLARVVANLIDNARHHAGGVDGISVTAHDGYARLTVDDRGPGVPPELREQIFERFTRGGLAGTRSDSHGAGLGLALVARHVHLHGGSVRVLPREGGGARFVVELPLAGADLTSDEI